MDRAVLNAYGWSEVDLDHDFRSDGKEAWYALSEGVEEELLRKLLELNSEIAAKEQLAVSDLIPLRQGRITVWSPSPDYPDVVMQGVTRSRYPKQRILFMVAATPSLYSG
jgi:hypothetical protein